MIAIAYVVVVVRSKKWENNFLWQGKIFLSSVRETILRAGEFDPSPSCWFPHTIYGKQKQNASITTDQQELFKLQFEERLKELCLINMGIQDYYCKIEEASKRPRRCWINKSGFYSWIFCDIFYSLLLCLFDRSLHYPARQSLSVRSLLRWSSVCQNFVLLIFIFM